MTYLLDLLRSIPHCRRRFLPAMILRLTTISPFPSSIVNIALLIFRHQYAKCFFHTCSLFSFFFVSLTSKWKNKEENLDRERHSRFLCSTVSTHDIFFIHSLFDNIFSSVNSIMVYRTEYVAAKTEYLLPLCQPFVWIRFVDQRVLVSAYIHRYY